MRGQTVSQRVKMKLATHTRPASSRDPKARPSWSVSSKAGTVPRTGSGRGTGVRSAQITGHAASAAITAIQRSGRPAAVRTAASMRAVALPGGAEEAEVTLGWLRGRTSQSRL